MLGLLEYTYLRWKHECEGNINVNDDDVIMLRFMLGSAGVH